MIVKGNLCYEVGGPYMNTRKLGYKEGLRVKDTILIAAVVYAQLLLFEKSPKSFQQVLNAVRIRRVK